MTGVTPVRSHAGRTMPRSRDGDQMTNCQHIFRCPKTRLSTRLMLAAEAVTFAKCDHQFVGFGDDRDLSDDPDNAINNCPGQDVCLIFNRKTWTIDRIMKSLTVLKGLFILGSIENAVRPICWYRFELCGQLKFQTFGSLLSKRGFY